MLLDSLVNKSVAAPLLNQGVKNGLNRVLATALAVLMLFSTVAGPVSSIFSRANEDGVQIEPQNEEIVQQWL